MFSKLTFPPSDVEIIRKFVNDALTSGVGGEDAFVYQKLSNLEFVGIAFKPILFDLKKDVGCRGLVDKWAEVWREPDRIRDLSDKLVSAIYSLFHLLAGNVCNKEQL